MKRRGKAALFSALLVFSALFSFVYKWTQTGNPFNAETILVFSVVLANASIIGWIASAFFKKYSKMPVSLLKIRIVFVFMAFTAISLLVSLLVVSLGVFIFYLIQGLNLGCFFTNLLNYELSSAVQQYSYWILILSALFFYIIWRKSAERELRYREESIKYRYINLKTQLNPHFLFNSLNALSEMVYEDAGLADRYLRKLSEVYRYILDNEETELVSLDDELAFVSRYFELHKERNNDKIKLHINIENPSRFKIIPVSIQILVENALKHNSMSKSKPLCVYICISEGYVVVSNTLQKKSILESKSSTGLQNLNERVKQIMNKEIVVSERKDLFIVKLPLIVVE